MSHPTKIYVLAVAILVLIGFALALARLPGQQEDIVPEVSGQMMHLAHDYFADANTFSGSITAPTPCDELRTEIDVTENAPEEIRLMLYTEASDEVCAQVLTEKGFTVVVPSSREAQLVAVELNGENVRFELD